MKQESNTLIGIRHCAIYASSETGNFQQLNAQVESCRKFANHHGWVVVEDSVVTEGGAAHKVEAPRPGLQTLVSAAKEAAPPFDSLVIADPSRLSRSIEATLLIVQSLASLGVPVYVVENQADAAESPKELLPQLHPVFIRLDRLRAALSSRWPDQLEPSIYECQRLVRLDPLSTELSTLTPAGYRKCSRWLPTSGFTKTGCSRPAPHHESYVEQ